jgi:cation diffusion facilitator CzcD-associated flavoprotein CzcO
VKIAIIGAGFAGLGAAIRLLRSGHRDLVLLERAGEVGGTWRDYVVPHTGRPVRAWRRAAYRRLPATQSASRLVSYWMRELMVFGFVRNPKILKKAETIWRRHLERGVRDPVKREKLTPNYNLGCKRVLPSNDFYPAVAASNVDIVTEKITEFRPDAVVTADGRAHQVDTVILATGFHVTDNPMFGKITGRGGVTLAAAFGQTYLGTVVPGFPNYFQLTGANTGLGHSSMVFMIESQLTFVADAVRRIDAAGAGPAEVRPRVAAAYNAELQRSCHRPSGARDARAGTWTARAATCRSGPALPSTSGGGPAVSGATTSPSAAPGPDRLPRGGQAAARR